MMSALALARCSCCSSSSSRRSTPSAMLLLFWLPRVPLYRIARSVVPDEPVGRALHLRHPLAA